MDYFSPASLSHRPIAYACHVHPHHCSQNYVLLCQSTISSSSYLSARFLLPVIFYRRTHHEPAHRFSIRSLCPRSLGVPCILSPSRFVLFPHSVTEHNPLVLFTRATSPPFVACTPHASPDPIEWVRLYCRFCFGTGMFADLP